MSFGGDERKYSFIFLLFCSFHFQKEMPVAEKKKTALPVDSAIW